MEMVVEGFIFSSSFFSSCFSQDKFSFVLERDEQSFLKTLFLKAYGFMHFFKTANKSS